MIPLHTGRVPYSIQGHRGARGLYPENTIRSFIEAVKLGVDALELDVVISKDKQVVVSHEPWMNHEFCSDPKGKMISVKDEKYYNLFRLDYSDVKKFDCGILGNTHFPKQKKLKAYKPLLKEVIEVVEKYIQLNARKKITYTIEIKSESGWDNLFCPEPEEFVKLVYDVLNEMNVLPQCVLQSFDNRILKVLHKAHPDIMLALLVENNLGCEENIRSLGFKPNIYCPEHILISEAMVYKLHNEGIRLYTWTVNEEAEMKRLVEMGVSGIITDYPDRAVKLFR